MQKQEKKEKKSHKTSTKMLHTASSLVVEFSSINSFPSLCSSTVGSSLLWQRDNSYTHMIAKHLRSIHWDIFSFSAIFFQLSTYNTMSLIARSRVIWSGDVAHQGAPAIVPFCPYIPSSTLHAPNALSYPTMHDL